MHKHTRAGLFVAAATAGITICFTSKRLCVCARFAAKFVAVVVVLLAKLGAFALCEIVWFSCSAAATAVAIGCIAKLACVFLSLLSSSTFVECSSIICRLFVLDSSRTDFACEQPALKTRVLYRLCACIHTVDPQAARLENHGSRLQKWLQN